MAEAILAQIKKPTKPTTQSLVSIQYKKPTAKQGIKLTAKIVDKRDDYDRSNLLSKIQKKIEVESKISPKVTEKVKDFDELTAIEKLETLAEATSQKTIDEKIVDATIAEETSKPLADVSEISEKLLQKPTISGKKKLVLRPQGVQKVSIKPKHTVVTGLDLDIKQIQDKLPVKEPSILIKPEILIEAPAYYMNNREIFINFVTNLLQPYKDEIDKEITNLKNSDHLSLDTREKCLNKIKKSYKNHSYNYINSIH